MTLLSYAPQELSLFSLLKTQAAHTPHAVALTAPGRPALTYGRLGTALDHLVQTLHALGIERHDRVALVLPDGPEMAMAFLAVASSATCAPLNPAYRSGEFEFYLDDLRAKAIVLGATEDSPVRAVARSQGIPLIELTPMASAEAGLFSLSGDAGPAVSHDTPQAHDVALVLHTSGTTARPKLVPLTHANLCSSARNIARTLALTAEDRCLNIMPLFHIHGLVGALLASLCAGASVACTPGFHARHFFSWLAECRPTWYTAVPTMHHAIVARAAQHRQFLQDCPLRFLRSSSAALSAPLMQELEDIFQVPVIEAYGMTEAAHQIASNPLPPGQRQAGSVGRAAGPQVTIMDEAGQVLAPGEVGEIVIHGANVTSGYASTLEVNAEAFHHGWFRTGDQGYIDAEGFVFVTGRLKEIINRGGEKIAPREVDEVLMAHPAVAQAVTFPVPHAQLGEEVAAAIVLRAEATTTVAELRAFAATRLADFKIPRRVLLVESLPHSATGKLQRRRLAEQLGLTAQDLVPAAAEFIAPRTPLESTLARLWAQVLGLDQVGSHDDFFRLGGDSVLATQILARVRQVLQVDVSFLVFFEQPTVAGMASTIATAQQQPLPARLAIAPDGDKPLSFAQQRLWFLDQLEPANMAYNRPVALRLTGTLNLAALEQSLHAVVQRHDILRTTFPARHGQPVQVIAPALTISLPVTDLSALPDAERAARAQELLVTTSQHSFDLAQGPLLRTMLLRLCDTEYIFLVATHHIVFDGWSVSILVRELATLYDAAFQDKPCVLPPLAMQYADFARYQQERLQGAVLQKQLAFWQQQLGHHLPILDLPTDWPRPPLQTLRGAQHTLLLPATLRDALKALSQQEGATLFMTLLAAFQALLQRYTAQDDIVVGVPVAGRTDVETEALIGVFVNSLVLRTDLSGNPSFREALQRLRSVALHAYAHQDVPFEKLVETLQPQRDLSRTPLFQVMFQLRNLPNTTMAIHGLRLEEYEFDRQVAMFDLAVDIREQPSGLACVFEYNVDLFEAMTIRSIAEHFHTLLAGIVAHPQQRLAALPLLTAAEQQHVLVAWNATRTPLPQHRGIHELFAAQVARTPEAVAVEDGAQSLTYQALNQRANQLANYLQRHGVGPEILVGLCVERSLDMLVGLFGILKAGGAYVPLDPTYPQERLAFMLQDTAVPIVLTQQRLRTSLPAHEAQIIIALDSDWQLVTGESQANPCCSVTAENLAYVIYTSGSTGQPKGVMIEHQALVNYTEAASAIFALAEQDRVLQFASLNFDVAAEEIFTCLTRGGTLVLRPDNMLDSVPFFLKKCQELALTVIDLPTAYWHEITTAFTTQALCFPPQIRLVVMGGEKTSPQHLALWYKHVDQRVGLVHAYGPTEATVSATLCVLSAAHAVGRHVPIGRPIQNMEAYVLDAHLQPVPIGMPGELYIGGVGLARGYFKRPGLQATQFIPHPYCDIPETRLYKTGDLVCWRPDGYLEFLGRRDSQVKIRGFRIEIGEIEALLHRHPAVRQALVMVHQETPGRPRLLAYLIAHPCPRPATSEMRHFVQQTLPNYMIPAAFVWLEAFPLLPNGKVDYHGLPAPDLTAGESEHALVAPRTIVEEMLARLWQALLGVQHVGSDDNFFALGGHSLVAAQLTAHISALLQVALPLRQIFQTPTLTALAQAVLAHESRPGQTEKIARILKHLADMPDAAPHTAAGIAGFSPQVLALLPSFLTEAGMEVPPTIPPRDQAQPVPLSFAQQRLWFLDQFEPGKAFYNITVAYRLQGLLQKTALEKSLNDMVRRHEVLRTAFTAAQGQPLQTILPTAAFPWQWIDLQDCPEADRAAQALQLATAVAQQPFDLSRAPLCRAVLMQLTADEYVFVLILHHIIADGWSCNVFFRELTALYAAHCAGETMALPALPMQYADYAVWQQQWLQGEVLTQQLAYWRQQLAGSAPRLELPTDRPRPDVQTFHGARQSLHCTPALSHGLKALSHKAEVTLFMTLLAALQTLLHRYSGQQDILIGSPMANRPQPELEGLLGFFVNTLVLRTTVVETLTFREVLVQVREVALGAYAHQDLPFEKLVEALQPERHLSYSPFFQVMFVWQNTPHVPLALQDLTVTPLAVENGTAKFDLTLYMWEEAGSLQGFWEYNTDLFEPATITRLTGHFQTLLAGIVADPDQAVASIPLLTPAERQQILVTWNATQASYPRQACLHELFEQQVERTPDAIAVQDEHTNLTYDELNRRANNLAHYLQERGVGPETLVGICLERSVEMVVGLFGILKAGGAYVPLDPAYPAERLAFMLHDARLPVLLTRHPWLACLPAQTATVVCMDTDWTDIAKTRPTNPDSTVQAESVAYVIYTSGSTGLPKGVLGRHRGAVNRAVWMWETYPFQPGEVCCQKTSLNFVDSVWEIFGPLLQGVPLVMISDDDVKDPHRLVQALAMAHVTRLVLVPSLLRLLCETFANLSHHVPQLNLWISSGEALPIDLAQRFWQHMPQATLLNLYGSSEVAADATWHQVKQEQALSCMPIGRPVANTQVYLLDAHLRPVPIGMPGELYIGGDGLARGYLHRPELTAARFLPQPFCTEPGALLYKTGDVARYLPDGTLVYLGRLDHQVKIRGVRVELAEIEAVLLQHPAVAGSVALVRHEHHAGQRLVAYLVAAGEARPVLDELRQFLQAKLPAVMIPEAFMWLHTLPLTPNGKVDRQALPAPDYTGMALHEASVAPRDPLELRLKIVWEQLLGKYPIGVHDNFFALGGHSLLAVRLVARLERTFQVALPLASLFHAPTVAQFANLLRQSGVSTPQSLLLAYRSEGSKAPFFCIHGVELLGRYLAPDQPYYALYPHALDGRRAPHTVEAMAQDYLQEIRALQPEGPYFLGGVSLGGLVALTLAHSLWQQGQEVGFLALIDPPHPGRWGHEAAYRRHLKHIWRMTCLTGCEWYLDMGYRMPPFLRRPYFHAVNYRAVGQYVPPVYPGRGVLFQAMKNPHDPYAYWPGLLAGGLEVHNIPGSHLDLIFNEASVQILGASLTRALALHSV